MCVVNRVLTTDLTAPAGGRYAGRGSLRGLDVKQSNGRFGPNVSCEKKTAIIEAMRNGRSGSDVAREHGVSHDLCSLLRRRAGIPPRNWTRREVNRDYFEVINTPEKARFLGLLAADGCVTEGVTGGMSLTLSLKDTDRDLVEAFRQAISYSGPVVMRPQSGYAGSADRSPGEVAVLSVGCTKMCSDLARHGVTPRKSLTAQPWQGPPELMRFYFGGLVDGDGWLFQSNGCWTVGLCGSEAVVSAFANFGAEHTGSRATPKHFGSIWRVNYCGTRAPKVLCRLLYTDLCGSTPLARKAERALQCLAATGRPFAKQQIGSDPRTLRRRLGLL
jgi:hypothetical protein